LIVEGIVMKRVEIESIADFANMISHDFNAPLRQARMFNQFFNQSLEFELTEEQQSYQIIVDSNIRRLEGMISGILRFSRIKKERDLTQSFCLNPVIKSLLQQNDHYFCDYHPKFDIQVTNQEVQGEEPLIYQALEEIIKNAVFYSDSRKEQLHICITAEMLNSKVYISIQDNGLGLDPQYHDYVQQPFKQIPTHCEKGVGIGLSIACKILDIHADNFKFESELGTGTKISFNLPTNNRLTTIKI